MLFNRTCGLAECGIKFQTDNPRKKHCSDVHQNRAKARKWRANHRKKGGGGGGGGNGGGGGPTLFDELVPIDPQAIVLTGIRYRTPPVPSEVPSKPAQPERRARYKKAA